MSEYRSFERCVVCRSRNNLKIYDGDFEETLLLNTLYMTIMFPIEMRQSKGTVKAKKIVSYLEDYGLVNTNGNEFDPDTILRCLRNALAHFNVEVESFDKKVSSIKLWAINRPNKTVCKPEHACNNPQCIPKQYATNKNGEICTFVFTMSELREFTHFVIDHVLDRLPSNICKSCPHKST